MSQRSLRFEFKLGICIALLTALALWTYRGSIDNQFVWDSQRYLSVYQDHISQLNFENIKWMATSLEFSNWHPLTWFSWAIDYQIYGGLNAAGYHFSNNLLHAFNGLILFALMLMVFGLTSPSSATFAIRKDNPALLAAFLAALLFIVHPQHVESVAWVAERKDLLCQLFLLLSLIAYIKYVTSGEEPGKGWFNLTLAMFFLAVLSKPMAVTFPVILLLIDIYPLGRTRLMASPFSSIRPRSFAALIMEKTSFFLLSLVLVLLTLLAQQSAMSDLALIDRIINAVNSIVLGLTDFVGRW